MQNNLKFETFLFLSPKKFIISVKKNSSFVKLVTVTSGPPPVGLSVRLACETQLGMSIEFPEFLFSVPSKKRSSKKNVSKKVRARVVGDTSKSRAVQSKKTKKTPKKKVVIILV